MNIGIVGLGLIGGSLAKAYKKAGATVLGSDQNNLTTEFAKMAEAIDGELDEAHFSKCDVIFIAITPVEAIKWMDQNAPRLSRETIIIDCCGTKRHVCKAGYDMARRYGINYLGGHPMAGKEKGGFKHSSADLFDDAPFILVPDDHNNLNLMCKVKKILQMAGFGRISFSTAEEHDKVIAFTSQMPHIVSNGFIKSKTAILHNKNMVSAGSYKDFTRVAYLDEKRWTELFIENRDNLGAELAALIAELQKYQQALEDNDPEELIRLLKEGKECKSKVDKLCDLNSLEVKQEKSSKATASS